MPPKRKHIKLFGIIISLIIVLVFILTVIFRASLSNVISGEGGAYGVVFVFFTAAFLEFLPQYIAPHLLIVNSAILGAPVYSITLIVMAGSTIGALIGFDIGRKYGLELTQEWFGDDKIEKIEKLINEKGKWIVALAAISPLPYVPLIFGSLGMGRANFYIYGLIPRALGFAIIGLFFAV